MIGGIAELLAREAIRHTIASYNHAGDRGRVAELAETFTPDGVLEVRRAGEPDNIDRAEGRSAIIEMLTAFVADGTTQRNARTGSTRYVRHFVTGTHITLHADRAEVASYFAVLTGHGLDHWGRYRDVLVPVHGRWLLSERIVWVDRQDG
ncbi:nuclear transport factor 2 family protein [Tomitella biformata]|uniref:nuclear transport factor 2 family protein n=1 Tax=Tomitella biformata TaxID=630403 RepID=UPI0004B2DDB5|nr:nuclear transport factor 2 family protein [Tomitella biformata]